MPLKQFVPKYIGAPEVERVGRVLVPKNHPHLITYDVRVDYVFNEKTPKDKGKEIWGRCHLITGMNAFLSNKEKQGDSFFVIEIAKPIWLYLGDIGKEALTDHELCHAWAEEEYNEKTGESEIIKSRLPHDLEEFACIYERYGAWAGDVKRFAEVVLAQPSLFEGASR